MPRRSGTRPTDDLAARFRGDKRFRSDLPAVLAELGAREELVWATAWEHHANLVLAPVPLPRARSTERARTSLLLLSRGGAAGSWWPVPLGVHALPWSGISVHRKVVVFRSKSSIGMVGQSGRHLSPGGSGPGDADNAAFEITGSTLKTARVLDFETKSSYSIRVRATDDGTPPLSVERVFAITVTDTAEPPTASAATATTDEDATTTITLSASDPEGDDPLSFAATAPSHGSLGAVGPVTCDHGTPNVCTGDVVYTPTADYHGADASTYTASDGSRASVAASVSITVRPVNDVPVATSATLSTDEDTPLDVDLGALAADVETADGSLTYEIVTAPASGALAGSGAARTYTPAHDFHDSVSFQYRVTDRGDPDDCSGGPPACSAARISSTETVTITVAPVNDPPTLGSMEAGALAYTENGPATAITATTTVADVDSASFATGTLTIDYTTGATADDRLAVRDEGAGSGQIGVSGSTVSYGGTAIGSASGGTGTTPLIVTLDASATAAAVQALVRAITYRNVSDAPSTAARTVRFVLTDGDGATSVPATRAITVTAVDDAPVNVLPAGQIHALRDTDTPITGPRRDRCRRRRRRRPAHARGGARVAHGQHDSARRRRAAAGHRQRDGNRPDHRKPCADQHDARRRQRACLPRR